MESLVISLDFGSINDMMPGNSSGFDAVERTRTLLSSPTPDAFTACTCHVYVVPYSGKANAYTVSLNFYAFESLKDMENYYRFNAELSLKKISYLSALVGSTACFIDKFIFQFGFLDAALGYTVAKIMTMYIWRQYKEGTVPDLS